MSDRFTRGIRDAILEGRDPSPEHAEHLATCEACRAAADEAHAFDAELEAALGRRRSEALLADPLLESPPPASRSWLPALAGVLVLVTGVAVASVAGPWLAVVPGSPSPTPSPSPDVTPTPDGSPTPSPSAEPLGAGTLARVIGAAAVLDEPGGRQWALLEPDRPVLVIDVVAGDPAWYRVEFEYCCASDRPIGEWVFGWVAGDLRTAGVDDPGFGIEPSASLEGPTLVELEWSCPQRIEDLYRVPEPMRHTCYELAEQVTIRGVIRGGRHGEALYPGDPEHLTDLPNASLAPSGSEGSLLAVHISEDPLLLAWLNDDRVRTGEELEVTGVFGPGAVVCTKEPRLPDLPPMAPEEQQLWCDQQFSVTEIHDDGGLDPIVEAPLAAPLWTPPPGTQPSSGEGWRLLASATRNQLAVTISSETVDYAIDAESYRRLWLSMATGDPPPVDFAREIVFQFVPSVSGTCPWIAFTGVGVDEDEELMFGIHEGLSAELFIDVPENFGCTSDATPHAFLVAVDRALAPADSFRLRLQEERLCVDCGITWDEVVVRLDD